MKKQIRAKFETYRDEMLEDLAALVAVNSVCGTAAEKYPFGEGPAKALELALAQGERMGFATENVDNYAGTIDLGTSERMIGVLAHLDIVPAGQGWTSDPFKLTLRNNRLYGRGVVDDKGPVVAALYGMRILRDLQVPLSKRIRLIMGTNEELGSACMKYYAEHRPIPECGFTPDADYPLINGEKGNFLTTLSFPNESTPIRSIQGGEVFNAVPAFCEAVLDGRQIDLDALRASANSADTLGFQPEFSRDSDGNIHMVTRGVASHGSLPHLGKNAVVSCALILVNYLGRSAGKMVRFIAESIGRETDGHTLGLKAEDSLSGSLTFNLGWIRYNANEHKLGIDIRFPISLSLADMTSIYRKMTEAHKISFEISSASEPHYVPRDHEVVKRLMAAYRDVTGDEQAQPMVIGGGTYAKKLGKNFVAFGPDFIGTESTQIHNVDEHIGLERFLDHCVICTLGMMRLAMD